MNGTVERGLHHFTNFSDLLIKNFRYYQYCANWNTKLTMKLWKRLSLVELAKNLDILVMRILTRNSNEIPPCRIWSWSMLGTDSNGCDEVLLLLDDNCNADNAHHSHNAADNPGCWPRIWCSWRPDPCTDLSYQWRLVMELELTRWWILILKLGGWRIDDDVRKASFVIWYLVSLTFIKQLS